jgi:large subunit ribosomal protein L31e
MSKKEEILKKDTVEEEKDKTVEAPPKSEKLKEKEKPEEEIEIVEERAYTVNLREAWKAPRKRRTPRAIRVLREFVKRNMKVESVIISNEINEEVWERSTEKPPHKLKIRAVKDKEGNVIVYPPTKA